MLSTEHINTTRKFLEDADREYEAGNTPRASENLWCAASNLVIAEMQSRGIEVRTYLEVFKAVEQLATENRDPSLSGAFTAARLCYANFTNVVIEDDVFDLDRPHVHRFVNRMIELSNPSNN